MTAAAVRAHGVTDARLSLITPEERPLDVFGERRVRWSPGCSRRQASSSSGTRTPTWSRESFASARVGPSLPVDAIVSLPLVRGPELRGVPTAGELGFIPVDAHGRVAGLEGVYAAGDATDFPIKQGGLATSRPMPSPTTSPARHGAPVTPEPFRPVLRGMLLTGGEPRFLGTDRGRRDRGAHILGHALAPCLQDGRAATSRPTSPTAIAIGSPPENGRRASRKSRSPWQPGLKPRRAHGEDAHRDGPRAARVDQEAGPR
jgi:sulfide:quinone oxidoreductase